MTASADEVGSSTWWCERWTEALSESATFDFVKACDKPSLVSQFRKRSVRPSQQVANYTENIELAHTVGMFKQICNLPLYIVLVSWGFLWYTKRNSHRQQCVGILKPEQGCTSSDGGGGGGCFRPTATKIRSQTITLVYAWACWTRSSQVTFEWWGSRRGCWGTARPTTGLVHSYRISGE